MCATSASSEKSFARHASYGGDRRKRGAAIMRDADGVAIIPQKFGDRLVGLGGKSGTLCPHQWSFRITNRLMGIRRQVMELSYAQPCNRGHHQYTTQCSCVPGTSAQNHGMGRLAKPSTSRSTL